VAPALPPRPAPDECGPEVADVPVLPALAGADPPGVDPPPLEPVAAPVRDRPEPEGAAEADVGEAVPLDAPAEVVVVVPVEPVPAPAPVLGVETLIDGPSVVAAISGVATAGAVTLGVVIAGVVTLGIVALGTVTAGMVTLGSVTAAVRAPPWIDSSPLSPRPRECHDVGACGGATVVVDGRECRGGVGVGG